MTRGDKFLLAGLLCMALLSTVALYGHFSLFPGKAESVRAAISVHGKVVKLIDLPTSARSSFVLQGRSGAVTVEVDGARVRMLEASCPGSVCVRQGWIEHPGQSIVCIPGEILIRIEGTAPLDAVTR
jgi:hypothetical protein